MHRNDRAVSEYQPTAQLAQETDFIVAEYNPAMQSLQLNEPVTAVYDPAPHMEHAVEAEFPE